jgi:phosphohistidine phosphatase
MKTLLVLRHAKSSWKKKNLADHDRPLNKRGKRDAPKMGALILEQDLLPELILSSTASRARETALAVAESCGQTDEVRLLRDLYLAETGEMLEMLASLPGELGKVMVVGHNPGMEELVEALTGKSETMPTAALAWIELDLEHWSGLRATGEARLRQIWRPREIG